MDAARGINRTFEDHDPAVEWSRATDADAVKISVPGFKKEEIRVLVDNYGHLRTRGERQVAGARWARFQKDFKLPANSNVDGIRAKFENETLTITLPKKTPSPPQAAAGPVAALPKPEPRRSAAAIPELARPAPPTVPAAPLSPAAPSQRLPPAPSQKPQPAAERRPSLPRKPSAVDPPMMPALPTRLPSVPAPAPEVEPPTKYNGVAAAIAKPKQEEEPVREAAPKMPSLEEEEEKRMEREAMGKMEKDRKMTEEEAPMGATDMARRPRRGLLVNVAVAVVVLVGITVYVWHTLRNATGGAGAGENGHGHAGSYADKM